MNKTEFAENFNLYVKQKSESLVKDFENGKLFMEIVEPFFSKSWLRILFFECRFLILMFFIDKLKTNKRTFEKLKTEIKNVNEIYESLEKCEMCIYLLFEEIEKLNIADYKND